MAEKKGSMLGRVIVKLLILVPTFWSIVTHLATLMRYEASKACSSLVTILVLCVFASMLLTAMWLCILGSLVLYFISLQWSWMLSLSIIFILNLGVFIIVWLMIKKMNKSLFFKETTRAIREIVRSD